MILDIDKNIEMTENWHVTKELQAEVDVHNVTQNGMVVFYGWYDYTHMQDGMPEQKYWMVANDLHGNSQVFPIGTSLKDMRPDIKRIVDLAIEYLGIPF